MLDLLIKKPSNAFNELEKQFRGLMKSIVRKFARDPMLKRIEDVNSLYNIALLKLSEALNNFVYNPDLTDEHNKRRFIALLNVYIGNAMIDEQWAVNLRKRKPLGAIQSIDAPIELEDSNDDSIGIDVADKKHSITSEVYVIEIKEKLNSSFSEKESKIFNFLCEGYSAEQIAGKLGVLTSSVRHILYHKIQPKLNELMCLDKDDTMIVFRLKVRKR